jgi:hypothetical protein
VGADIVILDMEDLPTIVNWQGGSWEQALDKR